MYESHFGFAATPFSLNPDPSFYFQSKGHGHALAYLRFGVYQGEGFVVVTGEIGAGKTTLVRTLLSELDSQRIVAAQIVSTQLEAGDLLRSVAIAFGIAPKNLSKAELIASIEAFLTVLVTQGKRALLIVDEAQNLDLQAIEELRMLSNFQLGNHALLQSFLVGQPELRTLLTSKPMEQFRQRVIASCHLGPMDLQETRAYVEHRLKKVGWSGRPAIADEAFEHVFSHTGGIPRRVNLLCNRLLLAAYLGENDRIGPTEVMAVASEAGSEVSERPARAEGARPADGLPMVRVSAESVPARRPVQVPDSGPLLCVATDRASDVAMATLLAALQARNELPQSVLLRIGDAEAFALDDAFYRHLGVEVPMIEVSVDGSEDALQVADAMRRIVDVLDVHAPGRMIVGGSGNASLACALVGALRGIPFVTMTTASAAGASNTKALARDLVGRLAGAQAVATGADGHTLPLERLLADATWSAAAQGVDAWAVLAREDVPWIGPVRSRGYGLVMIDAFPVQSGRARLESLIATLRRVSKDIPVVWMIEPTVSRQLDALGLRKLLRDDPIAMISLQPFADLVALMSGAKRVLTDSAAWGSLATTLGVACQMIESDSTAPSTLTLRDVALRSAADGRSAGSDTRPAATARAGRSADILADDLVKWTKGEPAVHAQAGKGPGQA